MQKFTCRAWCGAAESRTTRFTSLSRCWNLWVVMFSSIALGFPTPMPLLVFPLDHSDHSHRLCLTCPVPVPCCVWIRVIPELADVPLFRRGHARLPAFLLPFMFSHVFGCSYFWRLDFRSLQIYVDPDFVCIKSDFFPLQHALQFFVLFCFVLPNATL